MPGDTAHNSASGRPPCVTSVCVERATRERHSPGVADSHLWTFAVAFRRHEDGVRVVVQVKRQGERVFSFQGNPVTLEAAVLSAAGWMGWLAETLDESAFSAAWENGIAEKLKGAARG